MKFLEIYNNKKDPVISFEIFPPKTSNGLEKLKTTLNDLSTLSPDFISVTYGKSWAILLNSDSRFVKNFDENAAPAHNLLENNNL